MLTRNRYEVFASVRRVIAETLAVPMEAVQGDTRIGEDLNATSMDVVTIAIALDDEFSIEIDLNGIPTTNVTVDWIAGYISSHLPPR